MSKNDARDYDPGTKWYEKKGIGALLDLSKIREHLIKKNLHNTYKKYPIVDDRDDSGPLDYRHPEGMGNDKKHPSIGSRKTHFGRNIDPKALPKFGENLFDPDPRMISRKLMHRTDFKPVPYANLLMPAWIQFMNHDWFFHLNEKDKHYELPLQDGDPFPENPMKIEKTKPSAVQEVDGVVAFDNEHTHWWDGTQLYGKDQEKQNAVRSFTDGKLKMQDNGLLEKDEKGLDLTGFNENYWIGLSVLHTMFTREHNYICDELKRRYPSMDDEQLFQKARLINSFSMAKIHTIEWTPAILDSETLFTAMNANWDGVTGNKDFILGKVLNVKNPLVSGALKVIIAGTALLMKGVDALLGDTVNKIREYDYVLNGIIGNDRDYFGNYFSLTEEFAAVYRLHPLLPDDIDFRSHQDDKLIKEMGMIDAAQTRTRNITESMEMEDILYSLGTQPPGILMLHNYPKFLTDFIADDGKRVDLSTIDIIRDRERQIPRYNEFRRQIGLPEKTSFADLVSADEDLGEALEGLYPKAKRAEDAKLLEEVYGDIEKVDLLIGCNAEFPWPEGFGFGETAFQIFILMASRRLMCDRFFTDDYDKKTYTDWGFQYCEDITFTDVLLRHYPSLRESVSDLKYPFFTWNRAGN